MTEHPIGHAAPPSPSAHLLRDDAEAVEVALDIASALVRRIGGSEHRGAWTALDAFSGSGLWAMNVAEADGGPGLAYETVARVFAAVAAGDAKAALMALNHVGLIEILRRDPDDSRRRSLLGGALRGMRFADACAERAGGIGPGEATRITRKDDGFVVTGEKIDVLGASSAHLLAVHATDECGTLVLAFIAPDAKGLEIVDRQSGIAPTSETVILKEVRVASDRVVPISIDETPSVHGSVAQFLHAAIDVGIANRVIEETIAVVRESAQRSPDGTGGGTSEDPFLLREIADLEVRLHTAEAVLRRAGRIIDAGLRDAKADGAAAASLAVAEAKVIAAELVLHAGGKFFELYGSATSVAPAFERHWRDARGHASADPVRWTVHAIGNYVVNGVEPPLVAVPRARA